MIIIRADWMLMCWWCGNASVGVVAVVVAVALLSQRNSCAVSKSFCNTRLVCVFFRSNKWI